MSTNALPPINQALLPPNIRNGNAAAKNAYQQGLAFEQVLVSQLAQQLVKGLDATASAESSDGAGAGGSSSTDPSASATSAYTQMLPSALTSSIMSGGGLGVAAQLAAAIDPAINDTAAKK